MPPKRPAESALARSPGYKRVCFPSPNQISQGIAEFPKIGRTLVYDRKHFDTGRVYIVDPPLRGSATSANLDLNDDDNHGRSNQQDSERPDCRSGVVSVHNQVCGKVKAFFRCYSKYAVHEVPEYDTEADFISYWTSEMGTWSDDELIIIYYHGSAGKNGKRYTWNMISSPGVINAYNLIERFANSGKSILFILEAYLPTRFTDISFLKHILAAGTGHVEVIATGQTGQSDDACPYENNFTTSVIRGLYDLLFSEKWYNENKAQDTGKYRAVSIPELLRGQDLAGNPYRIQLAPTTRTKKDIDAKVWRIRLDPDMLRTGRAPGYGTRKLVFVADLVVDLQKERKLTDAREEAENRVFGVNDDNDDGEDEGYGGEASPARQAPTPFHYLSWT